MTAAATGSGGGGGAAARHRRRTAVCYPPSVGEHVVRLTIYLRRRDPRSVSNAFRNNIICRRSYHVLSHAVADFSDRAVQEGKRLRYSFSINIIVLQQTV